MRAIGMLLGIPEEDQEAIRDRIDEGLRLEEGAEPASRRGTSPSGTRCSPTTSTGAPSIPSDDLMTELLTAEFEDETGTTRRLTRDGGPHSTSACSPAAGNETTTRLIGWTGKLLGRAPRPAARGRRRTGHSVPNAIEELLRYEAPSPVQARYVTRDVEHHGQTVPEGSVMLLLNGLGEPRRPPVPRRRLASTSTARSATT